MKTVCENNKCNGCMLCQSICPKDCISIKDKVTHFNAVIDENSCINCNLCVKKCPNVSDVAKNEPKKWLKGYASEKEVRLRGSSGGIASEIIKSFITSKGYVASCLFENGSFVFDITNDPEIAKKFAGSKYVKSNPSGIYEKIRNRIKTDKVLFIGLPCQVAAVKNYVGSNDSLYTIDLICHGTPSSKLLDSYLKEMGVDVSKIENVYFRRKSKPTKSDRVLTSGTDTYLCAFLEGGTFTENCYECKFATEDRVGDLTLGDAWGCDSKNSLFEGNSLVVVNTKKGDELLKSSKVSVTPTDKNIALEHNANLHKPSVKPRERELFFRSYLKDNSVNNATFKTFPKKYVNQKLKHFLLNSKFISERIRFQITLEEKNNA